MLSSLKGSKGFGLRNVQSGRKFELGFHLKPKRKMLLDCRLRSPAFMSSFPLLVSEVQLGAAEAELLSRCGLLFLGLL